MVNRKLIIILAAAGLLCVLCGVLIGKGMYDKPLQSKIERDTVTVHDTVPDLNPVAKDSALARYKIKWLPLVSHDTVFGENYAHNSAEIIRDTVFREISANSAYFSATDSVAVAVPITTKHYGTDQYDAWVSGFEASLDSIKVYRETQYITERVTVSKPPNKWSLDIVGGVDYNTASKEYTPYALGELMYQPSRLQLGIQGGVVKHGDKAEPIIGGKVKLKIF